MSVFVIKGIFLSNYTMATARYGPAVGCKRTLADPKGQLCIYIYITSPKGQQKFEDSHFTPQSKGYYEIYCQLPS